MALSYRQLPKGIRQFLIFCHHDAVALRFTSVKTEGVVQLLHTEGLCYYAAVALRFTD